MTGEMALLPVVSADGWTLRRAEVETPPIIECPLCGREGQHAAGKILQMRAGEAKAAGYLLVCHQCLGAHFGATWPVLDSEGNGSSPGWDMKELLRISKTRDRRTDT